MLQSELPKQIMVSVVCNAYNQEKYIKSALDGFVMQKTTFPFEVLIHDDASTDHTADIIREYAEKYPEIMKPIYETENQYSKYDGSLTKIQYGRVQGKYIAICEGDDYWTDPLKLQKQVDVLEKHPELDICAHAAYAVQEKKKKLVPSFREEQIFPVEQVISGGGGFVETASLMYRSDLENQDFPFRKKCRIDYALQIAGSLRGGMYFLPDNMCCYRVCSAGSWSSKMAASTELAFKHTQRIKRMLLMLDENTNFLYTDTIQKKIRKNECNCLYRQKKYREILNQYSDVYKTFSWKKRAFICFKAIFSGIS